MRHIIEEQYRAVFLGLLVAIATLSFYCGMLEGKKGREDPVVVSCVKELPIDSSADAETPIDQSGMFVGSKHGTKYYTPECSGVDRIKEENRIWFKNAQDATLQGYTPASC